MSSRQNLESLQEVETFQKRVNRQAVVRNGLLYHTRLIDLPDLSGIEEEEKLTKPALALLCRDASVLSESPWGGPSGHSHLIKVRVQGPAPPQNHALTPEHIPVTITHNVTPYKLHGFPYSLPPPLRSPPRRRPKKRKRLISSIRQHPLMPPVSQISGSPCHTPLQTNDPLTNLTFGSLGPRDLFLARYQKFVEYAARKIFGPPLLFLDSHLPTQDERGRVTLGTRLEWWIEDHSEHLHYRFNEFKARLRVKFKGTAVLSTYVAVKDIIRMCIHRLVDTFPNGPDCDSGSVYSGQPLLLQRGYRNITFALNASQDYSMIWAVVAQQIRIAAEAEEEQSIYNQQRKDPDVYKVMEELVGLANTERNTRINYGIQVQRGLSDEPRKEASINR